MTREQFDAFVQRLEGVSRKNPASYRVRIVGLVVLAYGYLLLVLIGSLVMCIAMMRLLIVAGIIAFGGIFASVLRGLWVKLEAPKGEIIARNQAPRLFNLLDELRAALNCEPFHQVAIIGDVNAGVVQIPRLGIFGWHKNYLVIGLPLMQMLAPEEFKAVLAHEFAHSSRGHGRFGNWLYRVRRTWEQVFQQMLKRRNRFGFVVFKFVNWYWPIFNGHAFVLARANEYEADAWAVRLAGGDAAARALIRLRVDGPLLAEKFWPDTFARAKVEIAPPDNVIGEMGRALKRGPTEEDAARWLRQAFLIQTNNADTHPCLKDRLQAIGKLPGELCGGKLPDTAPPAPKQSAAEFYLGNYADVIAAKMSNDWKQKISASWKQRHERAQKLADELAQSDLPLDKPASAAEAWQKASKIVELHGDGAAVAALQQVIALEPEHAAAHFILGRHFLQTDDVRGVEHMESAIRANPMLTQNACNMLYAHFNRTGQRDKLRPLEHRFDDFRKHNAAAHQERARLTAADTFLPHELTAEQIEQVQKAFVSEAEIGRVAIARKRVQHFPKHPCFGIAIEPKYSWWKVRSSKAGQQLANRLVKEIKLPGNFIVFVSEAKLKPLGKKIFAVPGSLVYQRTEATRN